MKTGKFSFTKRHLELGYDSDCIMNSEDEEELNRKKEFERELILDERKRKRVLLLEKYELIKK